HPVAIVPLWWGTRRYLDLPALTVGAMIPDISYFIALQPVPNIGHSLSGIFLEGLPSAFVLLLICRYLLYKPLLALCPQAIANRFPHRCPYLFDTLPRLLTIGCSVVVSALTHIVWDSFTHSYGWPVKQVTWLSSDLGALPVYKWLQYGSSVVGFVVLLVLLTGWVLQQPRRSYHKTLPLIGKVVASGAIGAVMLMTIWRAISLYTTADRIYAGLGVRVVVSSVSGLFLGLCSYAMIFWMLSSLQRDFIHH
ncbi:MAG: DUF4184 family protein, partial [Cyanobacteria bacterium P01_F01_bin.53]